MIDIKDIPYSKVHDDGTMSINIPKNVKELPPVFDELTDEVTWSLRIENNKSITRLPGFNNLNKIDGFLRIENNQSLTEVTGFNSLTRVGGYLSIKNNESLTEVAGFNSLTRVGWYLSIQNNKSLTEVTGFNSLTEIDGNLWIKNNQKLVAMSIPGNLVRCLNYSNYCIIYDNGLEFTSPPEFINSPVIINDLVEKFNPGYHSTRVVKQIIENVEEWGTEETKMNVLSHLISKGVKHLIPQEFLNQYHPETIKNNNKIITEYLEMSN